MEQLQPLAIADIGLPSRHVVELAGVDEHYLHPTGFEQLVERDPVDRGLLSTLVFAGRRRSFFMSADFLSFSPLAAECA